MFALINMILFFLRWCPKQPELVQTIKTELAHSVATKRNQTVGSSTLQEIVANLKATDESCYKKKRDGTPSSVLKSSLTLIREGVAAELKQARNQREFVDSLLLCADAMSEFKQTLLADFPKLHSEFVDKFVKLQVRDELMVQWRGDYTTFEAFDQWRQSVLREFRTRCGVPVSIRQQQQQQTDSNRDNGLRHPQKVTIDSIDAFADSLKRVVYWDTEKEETPPTELVVTASLCLLQLGCGGRARDVILVNVIDKIDKNTIRVKNITKRKITSEQLEIRKPVLKSAFSDSDSFLDTLRQTRASIVDGAVKEGKIHVDVTSVDPDTGILHLKYEKQYDRDTGIEGVIQSWASRMRRLLKSTGHGTHFLRKLYVAASFVQEGESMKEPAWAQSVLGHSQYETSLLYTSVQICDSNKK